MYANSPHYFYLYVLLKASSQITYFTIVNNIFQIKSHKDILFTEMSQQNQAQKDGKQTQQQQQEMKKPAAAEWSMDLTSICGSGQNALKVQKRECLAWLLCILMGTTICILLLFLFSANPSMGTSKGKQADTGTLITEIDQLRVKNGQLAEEANAQKATIVQLRTTIEQQAKEIGQMLDEKNSSSDPKLTSLEQLGQIALHLVLILFIIFVCLLIIALVVFPFGCLYWLMTGCRI